MTKIRQINHVTLIVHNLEEACRWYEETFQLEVLPAFRFDYPAQFYKINQHQQLHLTEWPDVYSHRGHVCFQVDDFEGLFERMRDAGAIDIAPWGKVKRLPDGALQMFVRDPSGNLLELSSAPGTQLDPSLMTIDWFQETIYTSYRSDARGLQSDHATLYHGES